MKAMLISPSQATPWRERERAVVGNEMRADIMQFHSKSFRCIGRDRKKKIELMRLQSSSILEQMKIIA